MLSATSVLTVTLTIAASAQQPSPPVDQDRPFVHLVQNLGADIRALPSTSTGLVLIVGGAASIGLHPADDNLSEWAAERGSAAYTKVGRFAGDGFVQAGLAVGTYVAGLAVRDAETTHVGSDLIRGQLLAGIITRALKIGVDRTRPGGGGHSLPSGHSSAAFLSAAVIDGHYGWRAAIPAYATAGFIGWTRVRDNSHWLTDVLTGATVGIIVGRAVTATHHNMTWGIAPMATPGGAGVMVMKLR